MLVTSAIVLCDAIEYMLTPFKKIGMPAHEIAMMMSIALSFIPTFSDEIDDIKKAQISRGSSIDDGGLIKRVRALLPLMIPMFANAFRHAEELAMAMESRCYTGGEGRSHYRVLKTTANDWITLALSIILLATSITLRLLPFAI
jgi:energy-coupling factor transport system permease protein